ncbi:conjugal transfer protein [Staphylococcus agnetis]|nr:MULTISPECIES: conjugal transfer protein [Staphylococcus]ALN77506.1 conjugal transfer protein [Staphylococcus agnetis]MDG4943464.1 conjugal transfer protein [Staphylococcus agnetis]
MLLVFFGKFILSKISKKGKHFDVPEPQRKSIPKYKKRRKIIVILFYCFLALLFILLLASFIKASKAKKESMEAMDKSNHIETLYVDNAEHVQYSPSLKLYADDFIDKYINIPKDTEALETREKDLMKYFASDYKKPEEKTTDTERKLNSKAFYNIKRSHKQTVIQYIVNYDINITEKKNVKVKKKGGKKGETESKTEEKSRKVTQNVLINVPIKSENNKYVVVEYPYFTPIPDTHLNKVKMVEDEFKDKKREDNPKLNAFVKDFFDKYASSKSEDMAYLMKEPSGLEGQREVSEIRETRLYPRGDHYIVKAEVMMKDKDSPLENLEHYTLEVVKKDGKFYVNQLKNTIGG